MQQNKTNKQTNKTGAKKGLDLTSDSIARLRKGENAFTTAIRTVAEILQDYDYDKKVLGLTFGANR